MNLKIKLDDGAFVPMRGHPNDAGLDLMTPETFIVPVGGSCTVDTGVHVEIPCGMVGFLKSKSGLNVNHGIVSEGVIDSGYTGSIRVKLYNHGNEDYDFFRGEKISQLVIFPVYIPESVEIVKDLEKTERGNNGFGSTGR